MKILKKEKITDVYVFPGDTLSLIYKQNGKEKVVILNHEITEKAHYDTAIIFELENGELGLRYGLGGAFGKEE